jgi:hypothetical protein
LLKKELTYLCVTAVCLGIYSGACFIFLKGGLKPFIGFMSVANLMYCALTIRVLMVYYPVLSKVGMAYFLMEAGIIFGLSFIELNVAVRIKNIT